MNLARKALFVDMDDVGLTDAERESINREAEPENTKKVAKILRKIIVDYGLSENFVSRADVILEDLKKNSLTINQNIEKMIIKNPYQWIWTHDRWK